MALPSRQVEAATQVRHRAVDAQQFVAAAQLLALRVDQQQEGPPGEFGDDGEDRARLAQREIDADRRMVRGTDDGDRRAVERRRSAQEVAVGDDRMVGAEQPGGDRGPVHHAPPFASGATAAGRSARTASASRSGTARASSTPRRIQKSNASAPSPARSVRH